MIIGINHPVRAVIEHFKAAEQSRGSSYPETFVSPLTGELTVNAVTIPISLLRKLEVFVDEHDKQREKKLNAIAKRNSKGWT